MHPRVSIATVALAVAVMAASRSDVANARPMHAAIVSKYHRYLKEKETISTELDAWLKVYGPKGPKNGWIPVTESRSMDDELEDQRQRFYMTKEQISEARELNPMANFGTDGPFTLMTMDEFKNFLSNSHVSDKTDTPSPTTQTQSEKDKNDDEETKTWARATEGPVVFPMVRRLRVSGKSQYAYNGGDYSTDTDGGYQSTSDTYTQNSPQTYQNPTVNSGSNGGNTNGGYDFSNISPGDSSQVGTVSGGSNGATNTQSWNWWGSNGWGGNNTWSNNWWGGYNSWWGGNGTSWTASSSTSQWTQPSGWTPPSGSANAQWPTSSGSSNSQWTPPSGSANSQWPASSGSQQWTQPSNPTTDATITPETEAPMTDPPTTNAPVTEAPVTAPPTTPAPAPATNAPATAAPATQKKSTTSDTTTARDSDSDSVDWSTSACVNPPGLQGQCGSCWAFATVGALEAAQCIANGDKKAPTYSEQQLVSCDTKDFGCNGGAPVYAMEYVRDNGICTESSYPYSSVDGGTAASCSNSCTPTKSGITEIVQLPTGDESALLSAVKQQPVIVSVTSDNSAWKQYVSGVITSCDTTTVDHAVLVVGYDATSIKIKNSWGTEWGEDGYVRISRSKQNMGTCSVLTDMSYPKL